VEIWISCRNSTLEKWRWRSAWTLTTADRRYDKRPHKECVRKRQNVVALAVRLHCRRSTSDLDRLRVNAFNIIARLCISQRRYTCRIIWPFVTIIRCLVRSGIYVRSQRQHKRKARRMS